MRNTVLWLFALMLGPAAVQAQSRITVTLYDIAGLRPEVREAMKKETTRIFDAAGVSLEWVDCELAGKPVNLAECSQPSSPSRLMMQLVPGANKQKPKSSGMSVLQNGVGVFFCLYPDRLLELSRDANWEFGDLLGHAAAHEIGHLLLGTADHTAAGIMRARWETEDLRKLSHSGLVFLPGQLNRALVASQNRSGSRH